MIEVEIRGKLTESEFQNLKSFMDKEAEHVEQHEREMILFRGYEGYDPDPNARLTDIRLRKTNDDVEIMVKQKASDNNVGRKELSLPLKEGTWERAKEVLKSLGYGSGLWMSRKKDVYIYKGIEWSLVEAPDKHFYFEAEKEAEVR